MTLLYCDSFAGLSTAQIPTRYPNNSPGTFTAGEGRFGDQCFKTSNGNQFLRRSLGGNHGTLIAGVAFKVSSFANVSSPLSFWDSTTEQMSLRIQADGKIRVSRNGTSMADSVLSLLVDQWYFIEFKVVFGGAGVGSYEVKVNGVTWIGPTTADTTSTANDSADGVQVGGSGGSGSLTARWSDWYVCNASGSVNNTYLGDVRVAIIVPDGAGANTGFTPSAGSNWQNVDDIPPNDDTDYNSASAVSTKDSFTMTALPSSPVSILGVQASIWGRKTDAGARSVAALVRDGGTDAAAAGQPLLDTYSPLLTMMEQNPVTTAAWTVAQINTGDEFGYQVSA